LTEGRTSDDGANEHTATFECGVCWHVYDPAEGDAVWQVPPGVAFDDLPEDWRCPNCDGTRERFMRITR
jgi:rubredoxin